MITKSPSLKKLYKKVFIEEVGTLLYTSEGNIFFVQSNSRNHLLDSFGLSTVQYPAIQRTSVQEQFEEKIKYIDKKHLTINKKVWLKINFINIFYCLSTKNCIELFRDKLVCTK